MKLGEIAFYTLVGATGGALAAAAGWLVISKMIDRQFDEASAQFVSRGGTELRRTLDQEIPMRVRTEMDRKLAEVGINRTTGAQLARLLEGADRIGLIGLRGRR